MEQSKKIRRSLGIAVFVALLGALLYQFYVSQSYFDYIRQSNTRAFYDLMDYVKNIDTTLEKGIHTSTPENMAMLSSELWKESGGAQVSLSQLPLSGDQTQNVSKFLSQSGDYAHMLSKKVINQEAITDSEREQLKQLSDYAKVLVDSLMRLEDDINKGHFDINDMNTNRNLNVFSEDTTSGMDAIREQFSDYPTLIYDGPFSDHMDKLEPEVLKDEPEISLEQCRDKAAFYLGVKSEELIDNDKGEGNIKTYSFKYNIDDNTTINIDITRKGGYPLYILNNRGSVNKTLAVEDAGYRASEYLKTIGIYDMQKTYYYETDNVVTFNFAYSKDDVTYYGDLIKVSVALDDGQIVGLECRGYLMMHKQRDMKDPGINIQDAKAKLYDQLTVTDFKKAVIPTEFGTEVLCYEFLCENNDGRRFLVYVNADSGKEEKMFLLIEAENGTLTV